MKGILQFLKSPAEKLNDEQKYFFAIQTTGSLASAPERLTLSEHAGLR